MSREVWLHVVGRIRYLRMQGEGIEQQERLAKTYASETGCDWRGLLMAAQRPGPIGQAPPWEAAHG